MAPEQDADALIEVVTESPPPKKQKRSISPSAHSKPCSICHTPSDVLVRCRIDETPTWHFVCPKKCWKEYSGGVVDGDADHPFYKYGGMWKNKYAGVSAKKPKRRSKKNEASKGYREVKCTM